jgi:hypothetical protein
MVVVVTKVIKIPTMVTKAPLDKGLKLVPFHKGDIKNLMTNEVSILDH